MSDDLLRALRFLEEDYPGQPPLVQKADLLEINRLRAQLGMPPVDARLNEIVASRVAESAAEEPAPEPEAAPDHTAAREIYQAYLRKNAALEVHRTYAARVAEATKGHGTTPVRPLATMGTNGGPLLCDRCGKPMVLEGGRFHRVTADVAWKDHPRDWTSFIYGGMVVEIETNGTLRIYHGYPGGRNNQCCNVAGREDEQARAAFDLSQRTEKLPLLRAFIEDEFANLTPAEQTDLLNDILETMYGYDPGIGINRPCGEG